MRPENYLIAAPVGNCRKLFEAIDRYRGIGDEPGGLFATAGFCWIQAAFCLLEDCSAMTFRLPDESLPEAPLAEAR